MAFMSLPPRYPPDDRLPADTYRMVIARIHEEPAVDGKDSIIFSKMGILAILEAALKAEERLMLLEGPPYLITDEVRPRCRFLPMNQLRAFLGQGARSRLTGPRTIPRSPYPAASSASRVAGRRQHPGKFAKLGRSIAAPSRTG